MTDHERCLREGDISELKTNMKAAFHRIDELRGIHDVLAKQSDAMHLLAVGMAQTTGKVETLTSTVGNITDTIDTIQVDIEEIKRAPSDDYKYFKRQWLGGAVMMLIGYLLGALLKGVTL